ncbi:hypothetical protein TREMEDRAFT_66255, partial [Tremella mesenterica DSM 1558]|uniref:uncharacterized protein n=1 Tax=Tremella mesenterica (strain ATCC 24925 / CBS 8224 / DSM 1558 / NBRC 9311 / NRRL Y-6157 / RJB 2259-6 / UBC 559-6) TaxID=578456 RepID=UPI00032BF45C
QPLDLPTNSIKLTISPNVCKILHFGLSNDLTHRWDEHTSRLGSGLWHPFGLELGFDGYRHVAGLTGDRSFHQEKCVPDQMSTDDNVNIITDQVQIFDRGKRGQVFPDDIPTDNRGRTSTYDVHPKQRERSYDQIVTHHPASNLSHPTNDVCLETYVDSGRLCDTFRASFRGDKVIVKLIDLSSYPSITADDLSRSSTDSSPRRSSMTTSDVGKTPLSNLDVESSSSSRTYSRRDAEEAILSTIALYTGPLRELQSRQVPLFLGAWKLNGCPDVVLMMESDAGEKRSVSLSTAFNLYTALHSVGVIHNDVARRHVLIDSEGTARLIDFDLSFADATERKRGGR